MRLFSALLCALSFLATFAQPAPCDGLSAGFSFAPSGGGYQFSNATTGTGATTTWSWDFDDGTTSANPQPFHEFPASGVYEVCLTAISIFIDENGGALTCVDTYCANVTVQGGDPCDLLEACFVPSQVGVGTVFFNNCTQPSTNTQYVWTFGDGSTGSDVAPTHTYLEPGTYTVCLTAYWNACVDSICTTIVVEGADPCVGFNACFESTPQGGGAFLFENCTTPTTNVQYVWFFGDGSTSSGVDTEHTYAQPGSYTVCLRAYWQTCLDSTCTTIIVQGGGDPCDDLQAGFTFTSSPSVVQFANTTTGTGLQTTWLWIFADGTTSDNPQPFHTFPEPGVYEVCLKALSTYVDDNGATITCSDTYCANVTVQGGGDPCDGFDATLTWNAVGNNTIVFTGNTTVPGAAMIWHFGDGTEGVGQTVTHIYAAPGQYHVCLAAWYWNQQIQDSCWTETCVWITVGTSSPCDSLSADLWWQSGGTPGSIFYSATTGDGPHWLWSFGDGTFSDDGPQGAHTYPGPGEYQLCLTVFAYIPGTQDTCSVTTCQWITIGVGDPCDGFDATITWNASGGNTAVFAGTTTIPASGIIWHFGDGTEGFGPSVTHTYAQPGEYHVCLEAWYWNQQIQDSCWAETCIWITVGEGNPCDGLTAQFNPVPTGLVVNFQNAVVNNQWTYSWTFGDGTSGLGPNPFHTYASAGAYNVCLIVWTWDPIAQDTCFADYCEWVTVQGSDPCDQLEACFETQPISGTAFQFINCSTPQSGVQFVWHFGDGSMGSGLSPDHAYQQPGVYTVCLIAYWENCVDSTCTTLTVGNGTPCDENFEADFTWTSQGTATIFHGTTNPPANGLLWFFGDGTTGSGEVITHLYEPPGPYNVCLAAWYWNPQTQDTCWAEHCEVIDPFDPTNGIQDDGLSPVRIYPQPANELITIEGLTGPTVLLLFGPDGRLVMQERSAGEAHRLYVADLATGLYVLLLDLGDRSLRYRIAVE